MKCTNCQTSNSGNVIFCRHCGKVLGGNVRVDCESHPSSNATGVCVVCGRPVCDDCAVSKSGLLYCEDAAHALLAGTHVRLAAAEDEFNADLVSGNLKANGIPALVFSARKYSHFHLFTDGPAVSIYVPKKMLETAENIIKDLDLADFLQMLEPQP